MKKSIPLFLFFCVMFCCFSCSKASSEKTKLTVTDEEKAMGFKAFNEIGFKVIIPEKVSENKANIDAAVIGDEDDEDEPIYKAYIYQFASDSLIDSYNKIVNDQNLTQEQMSEKLQKEVYGKIKNIFALAALRTNLITEENSIEKILSFKEYEVLRKNDKFTQVICFGNAADAEDMDEKSSEKFKELIKAAKIIPEKAELIDPVAKKQSLKEIKNLKFKTTDLDGKEVTSEVFAASEVTMVNIWATWCPPCRAELPEIGNLARKYADKNCTVIGICSDVTDTDDSALERAKEILAESNCEFINIKKNASLDKIYSNIQAYPTTLFFDKNGNIIGEIIVGSRNEEAFAKALDSALASVKK